MTKWIVIVVAIVIGVMITLIGIMMFLYGVLSFFITWERNPDLNTIGIYSFFISIPVLALGIYILKKNWRYIIGKESWYR
jgi:hypothetical protein